MNKEDIDSHNEKAWDYAVEQEYRWSQPFSEDVIEKARKGNFRIKLSPKTPVPERWLGDIKGKKILGLAAGGGQQGPLLAAAGANMTVLDISSLQLELDRQQAAKFRLNLQTFQGSADCLAQFEDQSFDFIVNPLSNCFFSDLRPVWQECSRILKQDGYLMYAFNNPVCYQFDFEQANLGTFRLKYAQPYSDIFSLSDVEKKRFMREESPVEFGHTMEQQIGWLLECGFVLTDFFEDKWDTDDSVNQYLPAFYNVRARKL